MLIVVSYAAALPTIYRLLVQARSTVMSVNLIVLQVLFPSHPPARDPTRQPASTLIHLFFVHRPRKRAYLAKQVCAHRCQCPLRPTHFTTLNAIGMLHVTISAAPNLSYRCLDAGKAAQIRSYTEGLQDTIKLLKSKFLITITVA